MLPSPDLAVSSGILRVKQMSEKHCWEKWSAEEAVAAVISDTDLPHRVAVLYLSPDVATTAVAYLKCIIIATQSRGETGMDRRRYEVEMFVCSTAVMMGKRVAWGYAQECSFLRLRS